MCPTFKTVEQNSKIEEKNYDIRVTVINFSVQHYKVVENVYHTNFILKEWKKANTMQYAHNEEEDKKKVNSQENFSVFLPLSIRIMIKNGSGW